MQAHADIRIGTVVPAHDRTPEVIRQLLALGFESFQIVFGRSVGDFDVDTLGRAVRDVLDGHPVPAGDVAARVSSLGVYGNPLTSPETVRDWERLIDAASLYGCDVVAGFAGRGIGFGAQDKQGQSRPRRFAQRQQRFGKQRLVRQLADRQQVGR